MRTASSSSEPLKFVVDFAAPNTRPLESLNASLSYRSLLQHQTQSPSDNQRDNLMRMHPSKGPAPSQALPRCPVVLGHFAHFVLLLHCADCLARSYATNS